MDQNTYSILYEREILVWKKDEWTGKNYLAGCFKNMEEFFRKVTSGLSTYASYRFSDVTFPGFSGVTFPGFSSNFDEYQTYGFYPFDHKRYYEISGNIVDKNKHLKNFYCYLCFDCFDKHYSRDRLIGYYRIWRKTRRRYGWMSHSWGKTAYGSFRYPRSTQEKRWACAWDDEEFAPKKGFARPNRNKHNLPNAWDDHWSHNDRCWKTQSKRKHQWKPK